MKWYLIIVTSILLAFQGCKDEDIVPEECLPSESDSTGVLELKVSTSFEGGDMELYEQYTNVVGEDMSFEQVLLYLAEIDLVRMDGSTAPLTEIEYFNLDGPPVVKSFQVDTGNYAGLIYHIGVPPEMNGTQDPDFMTNIYDSGHPLNVQNGMYWTWMTGYRFLIYDGRVDTTPQNPNDFPVGFSIHLGKDTLYTEMEVELPFSIIAGETQVFNIDWDLAKCMYGDSDTLNLRDNNESQFHGENLPLGFRFRSLMRNAFSHALE